MSLGSLIKSAREGKGLTRQELADLVGANINSVSKYERAGEKHGQFPPLPMLAKLVQVLNLPSDNVFAAAADEEEVRLHFEQKHVRWIVPMALTYNWLDELMGDLDIRMALIKEEIEPRQKSDEISRERLREVLEKTFTRDDERHFKNAVWSLVVGDLAYPKTNGPDHEDPSHSFSNISTGAAPTASDHQSHNEEDDQK